MADSRDDVSGLERVLAPAGSFVAAKLERFLCRGSQFRRAERGDLAF